MAITIPVPIEGILDSKQAHGVLLDKLQRIPGVHVSHYTTHAPWQAVFEVALDDGDLKAEMAVYQAEMEVYQQFSNARFELYVI